MMMPIDGDLDRFSELKTLSASVVASTFSCFSALVFTSIVMPNLGEGKKLQARPPWMFQEHLSLP